MNPIRKFFLLFAVIIATSSKAQVPCTAANSPTFQLTTSQATMATNGVCGVHINVMNANTNPPPGGGAVSFSFIAPGGAPTTSVIATISGVWTVQVTDFNNNCTTSQTIQVIPLPAPTISIAASNTVVCAGQVATFTASGANTYIWNTNATTSIISVMPSANSTYSLIGTGSNGCANTAFFALNVNPAPNITATASQNFICLNETVTLSVIGANSYSWSTSQTGANITVTPTANAAYTVSSTNEYGCETRRQVFINVSPCTNVVELINENENFKIFPNPANDFIELKITNTKSLSNSTSILIFNSLGQKVMEEAVPDEGFLKIRTNEFESGVYYLQLKTNSKVTASKRFVIAR